MGGWCCASEASVRFRSSRAIAASVLCRPTRAASVRRAGSGSVVGCRRACSSTSGAMFRARASETGRTSTRRSASAMRRRSVRRAIATARGMARGRVTRTSVSSRRDSGTNSGTYRTAAHHAPIGRTVSRTARRVAAPWRTA